MSDENIEILKEIIEELKNIKLSKPNDKLCNMGKGVPDDVVSESSMLLYKDIMEIEKNEIFDLNEKVKGCYVDYLNLMHRTVNCRDDNLISNLLHDFCDAIAPIEEKYNASSIEIIVSALFYVCMKINVIQLLYIKSLMDSTENKTNVNENNEEDLQMFG